MAELRPGRVATQKAPPFHSIHLLQEGEICDSAAAKTHLISLRPLVSRCALRVLSVFGNCTIWIMLFCFSRFFCPFLSRHRLLSSLKKKNQNKTLQTADSDQVPLALTGCSIESAAALPVRFLRYDPVFVLQSSPAEAAASSTAR